MGARGIAARALARVWYDSAYAAPALDGELRRMPGVDPRDAGLATELVYGVLRTQGYLEERVAEYAPRGTETIPPEARAHLLMGAYTLCFLDRIPAFAAVSEAVSGVAATSHESTGRFANAVLRRLAAALDASGRPSLSDAVVASAPGWLRGGLRRSIGRAGAAAYLAAGPIPPPIGLCVATPSERDAWIERLRAAAPEGSFEAGSASPRAILVRGAGDVRRLPGFEHAWIVQEEGAQVVALALGARPGEHVLDACAGRGNKVFGLHHDVMPGGAVDASDLYATKLAELAGRGPWARATYAVDWTAGTDDVPGGYDRVLVDAPCSGTGTLRRRPEIALGRDATDVTRLSELQAAITLAAAAYTKNGGRLVFAVCSVLKEEAEDVVAKLVSEAPDAPAARVKLEPAPFEGEVAQRLAGEATTLRLLPHVHGTDGYFLASFVVRQR